MTMKLERCGYCGAFFRGSDYLTPEEVNGLEPQERVSTPLGYCPNAQAESPSAEADERRLVTRDMAIDAGDPSLEGQIY
jgi:hypothetical protein